MNTFSSYPSYKPSGLDWLDEMPSHWELRRLKFIASVTYSNVDKHTKEGEIPVRLCNYVDVYKNDHIINELEFMQATADSGEIKKFGLQKGDVIVTKDSEEWKDIAVPAFVPESLDGVICGYHLALIRPYPNQVDGEYLFRAFRAPAINYQFQVAASGITRYGLGKQALGDAWILLPSIEEQRAISAYLNRETAQIDTLIAKKRKLIDLLDKKRTSIISHAVTKGLKPKAQMKPSGVEWLGDVPEHWDVNVTKRFFKIDLGKMLNTSKQEDEDGEVKPYLRAANIYWNELWLDDVKEMKFSKSQLKRYRLEKGDLLVTEGGVTVGRSAIWHGELKECYYQNSINRARRIKDLPVEFLYYWLYFLKLNGYIDIAAEKATFGHLTKEKLEVVPIVYPPVDEAIEIIQWLDNELKYITEITAQIEESILLLQRQRIALISAAVTGKIDVREQEN